MLSYLKVNDCTARLEPPEGARNRRKATVKKYVSLVILTWFKRYNLIQYFAFQIFFKCFQLNNSNKTKSICKYESIVDALIPGIMRDS